MNLSNPETPRRARLMHPQAQIYAAECNDAWGALVEAKKRIAELEAVLRETCDTAIVVAQAQQRIRKLEAENKELLAIADNTALILAGHHIAELEETITRLIATGSAVIEHPCEVNWTALQYNISEASRLVKCAYGEMEE